MIGTCQSYNLNDTGSLKILEDFLLRENDFERQSIKRCPENLFSAVSFQFFTNEDYSEEIRKLCCSYLVFLAQTNNLPRRLQTFQNNLGLCQDYLANSSHSNFDLINLELVSMIFQRRVLVYEIEQMNYVKCLIINGSFENPIMFFKDKFNNYDCLATLKQKNASTAIRALVYQIVENVFTESKPIKRFQDRRDSDSFFEQLNDDIKKFSMSNDENEFLHRPEIKPYPLFCFDSNKNSPGIPESKLKLKPKPKLKVESNKEFINQDDKEFNFANNETYEINRHHITPLTFVKSEDHKNFSWEGEVLTDQTKVNSYSSFYHSYNYVQPFPPQPQPFDFYPRSNEKLNMGTMVPPPMLSKNKPLVLEESSDRFLGTLKFFDENKSFGFIIMDVNNSEIFFHFDDFEQGGVTKEMLMSYKNGNIIRLSFGCLKYIGKYNISLKAVEIKLVSIRVAK